MQPGRMLRPIGLALLLALAALDTRLSPAQAAPADSEPVTVKMVDYDALGTLVRSLKGKVVVVDLWNIT